MAYPPRLREECNGGMWTVESISRVLAYSSCWIQPDPMTFRKSANSPGEAPGIWAKAPLAGDFADASVERGLDRGLGRGMSASPFIGHDRLSAGHPTHGLGHRVHGRSELPSFLRRSNFDFPLPTRWLISRRTYSPTSGDYPGRLPWAVTPSGYPTFCHLQFRLPTRPPPEWGAPTM